MRAYLDLCCLKRPFDSQEHPLVRLETEAILALLGAPPERVQLLRCAVHALENAFNTVVPRREAVSIWLSSAPLELVAVSELKVRAGQLVALGMDTFDSLHVASAEIAVADVFVTVDYPLLTRARKVSSELRVRVTDPLRFAEEVFRDFSHH